MKAAVFSQFQNTANKLANENYSSCYVLLLPLSLIQQRN